MKLSPYLAASTSPWSSWDRSRRAKMSFCRNSALSSKPNLASMLRSEGSKGQPKSSVEWGAVSDRDERGSPEDGSISELSKRVDLDLGGVLRVSQKGGASEGQSERMKERPRTQLSRQNKQRTNLLLEDLVKVLEDLRGLLPIDCKDETKEDKSAPIFLP